jgi:hypothetical protein
MQNLKIRFTILSKFGSDLMLFLSLKWLCMVVGPVQQRTQSRPALPMTIKLGTTNRPPNSIKLQVAAY